MMILRIIAVQSDNSFNRITSVVINYELKNIAFFPENGDIISINILLFIGGPWEKSPSITFLETNVYTVFYVVHTLFFKNITPFFFL